MSQKTYYQKNKDTILNRAKAYYENNKEILRERAKNRYRELPADEKDLKKQYQKDRYNNMTVEEKQKYKEYQKNIVMLKNRNVIILIFIIKNDGEEYENLLIILINKVICNFVVFF